MKDNPQQPGSPDGISVFFDKAAIAAKKIMSPVIKSLSGFGRKMLPVLKIIAPAVLLNLVIFILLFLTGLGNMIGTELKALIGPVPSLLMIFLICFIPSISPLLGPGLLAAAIAGVLTGEQIAQGAVKPVLALAALFAIDAQIGGYFVPPGLFFGENEPETINAGVPSAVFTRLVTIPVALVLACLFSFLQ